MPDYHSIRFISYEIDTSPDTNSYRSGGGDDSDIRSRCDIMKKAMNLAWTSAPAVHGALTVFMAPEFYFRGTGGAYPVEKISDIMDSLRKETGKSQYRNWLFVMGTALGMLDAGAMRKEVFNIALVQRGGANDANQDIIVYKEFVSHIDFIRDKSLHWWEEYQRLVKIAGGTNWVIPTQGSQDIGFSYDRSKVNAPGRGKEKQKSGRGYGGRSIFTVDGITFGLEVCLDHAKGKLKNSPPDTGENRVQVQLIPSAGMGIEPANVVVVDEGLVFNVDGLGNTAHSAAKYLGFVRLYDIELLKTVNIADKQTSSDKILQLYSFKDSGKLKIFKPQKVPDAEVQA